jgi:hypothetical protein
MSFKIYLFRVLIVLLEGIIPFLIIEGDTFSESNVFEPLLLVTFVLLLALRSLVAKMNY